MGYERKNKKIFPPVTLWLKYHKVAFHRLSPSSALNGQQKDFIARFLLLRK